MKAREISTAVLCEIIRHGKRLDVVLARKLKEVNDKREIKLTRELCYGVMRWYEQLVFILNLLVKKPVKELKIEVIILSGLYQMKYLRVPDHAAISESVELTKRLGMTWAGNFVNAILRRFQRDQSIIEEEIQKTPLARYSHPDWMIDAMSRQWPEHWQKIFASNNRHPPMHLRLNSGWMNRQEYSELLNSRGIAHVCLDIVESGISLENPMEVEDIPGFLEGYITVQDAAAQLAASLMELQPSLRILDACAAPGGKTGHILELVGETCELVAVEIDKNRAEMLNDSLNRIHKQATIRIADITQTGDWWDGEPFDRILLDAPCTASGVIRRHPDVKYLRSPVQLETFCENQNKMLATLWPLLKPGGRLIYCTCSLFIEESDERIKDFVDKHDDVEILPIQANWGVRSSFGRHTVPGYDESDGFYYSVLIKQTEHEI